jgi:hypothetical protein
MSESVEEEGRRAGHQDRQQLGPSVMGTGVARDSEARGPEEGMSPRLGGGAQRWKERTAEYVERRDGVWHIHVHGFFYTI